MEQNSSLNKIYVAKSAGVCFGVDLAMKTAEKAINEAPDDVTGFGPLVHNDDVISRLRNSGVNTVDTIAEIQTGHVLLRAHGATTGQLSEIKDKGLNVINATCPLVMKPQRKAKEWSDQGMTVVIVGHPNHPEVKSVSSFAEGKTVVIEGIEQARNVELELPMGVISQTTLRKEIFDEVVSILRSRFGNEVQSMDTICFATKERQDEARELSYKVDAMIVVGGKVSSNTKKLVEVSSQGCKLVRFFNGVEDVKANMLELDRDFAEANVKTLGLTAGASTPLDVIENISNFLSTHYGAELFDHLPEVEIGSEKLAIHNELSYQNENKSKMKGLGFEGPSL
jgi:4-hydroxy-3-methylbut-2-enyl diphosphate reductase